MIVNVATGCDHSKIDGRSGYIRTRGYPSRRSSSYTCYWTITSTFRVRLTFDSFSVDSRDTLKVYDGGSSSSTLLRSYSGTGGWLGGVSVTSSSTMMYIHFNSGSRGRYSSYTYRSGVSARYQGKDIKISFLLSLMANAC